MSWDYKEWYRQNKEELLRKRRERYHSDEDYRGRQIAQAQKSHRNRKQGETLPPDRTLVQGEDGREFFSIGRLAAEIGRRPYTIREYHRNGVIPNPNHYDNRGWRLYSAAQVRLLRRTFMMFDEGQLKTLGEVSELLEGEWYDSKEGLRGRGDDSRHPNGFRQTGAKA